ncbi:MAG TPA: tetratricopeptide repeat protein [Verrucomicrobiota bacterium]|nr:tetratricopeptide repeat protein [Verrucomicrobiota bacterium]
MNRTSDQRRVTCDRICVTSRASRVALFAALLVALLFLCCASSDAASAREERMFNAAAEALRDGFWDRAEREFAEFVRRYPKSEYRSQAVLSQAQALYKLGDAAAAVRLLEANLQTAGELTDDYLFWLAETEFVRGEFARAAVEYARLTSLYPDSDRSLEAIVNEAIAYSRLGRKEEVVRLLTQADGVFEKAMKSQPANEQVVRGLLLLGETQLERGETQAASDAIAPVLSQRLPPALDWSVRQLRCRILLAQDDAPTALQVSTNMSALALAARELRPQLLAESFALQAQILERLNRLGDAIGVLQSNLVAGVPSERQREALLKTAELSLALGKSGDARQTLNRFLSDNPNTPVADMVYLSLGELDLKQHAAGVAMSVTTVTNGTQTNRLLRAASAFDELLQKFPESPLAGRALLGKAWCLWLGGDVTNSLPLFETATQRLPFSEDQAVARFKWADAQMATGDFAGALTNYTLLIDDYSEVDGVKTQLIEPALYLAARAATRAGNVAAATDAVGRILEWFPSGSIGGRSVLLVGQGLIERGDAAQAREMFEAFGRQWPESALLPQIKLVVARSYEQTGDWVAAADNYDVWIGSFTNHTARAQAEFYRAWANYQAGREAVAYSQFTNFVAVFPTNELAPAAQWWVADYAFRQSDFAGAERNYKVLFQTWPLSPLAYEARMMAGRAALARAQYGEAIGHFTNLTSDLTCPANLKVQALFAYGDTLVQEVSADTNKFANFEEAIRVYASIRQLNPTNAQAGLAWGLIGNCYLQIGARDAAAYVNATNAYSQAMALASSSVSTRSQAQISIGLVLEKMAAATGADPQALLRQALDNYLSVVYETNLRQGEIRDDFWVKKAGLESGRLVESLNQPEQAVKLYERLQGLLPALRESFEKRIARVKEQAAAARN